MTWDEFVLRIALGNDAMRTRGDVARALRAAAFRIESDPYDSSDELNQGDNGVIADENGNRVGAWSVTKAIR